MEMRFLLFTWICTDKKSCYINRFFLLCLSPHFSPLLILLPSLCSHPLHKSLSAPVSITILHFFFALSHAVVLPPFPPLLPLFHLP